MCHNYLKCFHSLHVLNCIAFVVRNSNSNRNNSNRCFREVQKIPWKKSFPLFSITKKIQSVFSYVSPAKYSLRSEIFQVCRSFPSPALPWGPVWASLLHLLPQPPRWDVPAEPAGSEAPQPASWSNRSQPRYDWSVSPVYSDILFLWKDVNTGEQRGVFLRGKKNSLNCRFYLKSKTADRFSHINLTFSAVQQVASWFFFPFFFFSSRHLPPCVPWNRLHLFSPLSWQPRRCRVDMKQIKSVWTAEIRFWEECKEELTLSRARLVRFLAQKAKDKHAAPFLIEPAELSGQMEMLYSPPQYGGIAAQTCTSHLRQDDAFVDGLPPASGSNPSGGVGTAQTALACVTGNINSPFISHPSVHIIKKQGQPIEIQSPWVHSD